VKLQNVKASQSDYLRRFLTRVSAGTNEIFKKNLWGIYLCCAIFSATFSGIVYKYFDINQEYSELIVGALAWDYLNKFHDYSLLFSMVFSFVMALIIIGSLFKRLDNVYGENVAAQLHEFLLLLCAPAGCWLLGLIATKNESLLLLHISCVLIVVTVLFSYLMTFKKYTLQDEGFTAPLMLIQEVWLLIILSVLSSAALGVIVSRAIPVFQIQHLIKGEYVLQLTAVVLAIVVPFLTHSLLSQASLEKTRLRVRKLILIIQIPLPFMFLILIPNAWYSNGEVIQGYNISPWLYLTVALCVALTFWRIVLGYRLSMSTSSVPLKLISSMSIIGSILFIKAYPLGVPYISPDDYHFGEFLTPWWSWSEFGQLPFWDYAPARGMVNYFQGAFASIFFDGRVADFSATVPFIYLGLLLVSFPVLTKSLGKGVTIIAFLIAPYINSWSMEIDVMIAIFICFFVQKFFELSPRNWLGLSFLMILALILFAPGQGGLTAVAVSPLALIMIYRYGVDFDRSQVIPVVLFIICLSLLAYFTPLAKMLFGAFRYAIEQSAVNSIAHGISWGSSFNLSGNNPWLFEFVRSSWILVTIISAVLILKLAGEEPSRSRNKLLAYTVPIFIITLLFIIRAAGRIDGGPSRLGNATIWAFSFLLPILFFAVRNNKYKERFVLLWVSLAGLMAPFYSTSESGIGEIYSAKFNPVYVDSPVLASMSATKARFPVIGLALADPAHIKRLLAVRELLDSVLDKNETYFDLTSRGAQYYYTNRMQPIESGAIYNLVTESQQQRAIDSLKMIKPPAILIYGTNITHDGGSASLRSYLIYRYVLLLPNYEVVETEDEVWLIRNDRLDRLDRTKVKAQYTINSALTATLDRIFQEPDLRNVPASWGRSYESLERTFHSVRRTSKAFPVLDINSVSILDDGGYQVIGEDPYIRFDISKLDLSGKDAGLVSFSFSCERGLGPTPIIEFFWSSKDLSESEMTVSRFDGRSGVLILPVDTTPSWLLAEKLQTIRFDVRDKASCNTFSIQNISFLQRNAVSEKI
jgi:hypothetical protein